MLGCCQCCVALLAAPFLLSSYPVSLNPMQVEVNGIKQEMPADSNLSQLLRHFEIAPEGIAVEINLTVIDQQAYDATVLHENDQIEIIRFIGGGTYAC